uniref:C2H2-type domain-containing protein n=1 Tax=Timema monikensis TaxID=170555 RepID=A0A7R9E4S9_9NEOP|nr:unnamed protein product [Timema monikensis]
MYLGKSEERKPLGRLEGGGGEVGVRNDLRAHDVDGTTAVDRKGLKRLNSEAMNQLQFTGVVINTFLVTSTSPEIAFGPKSTALVSKDDDLPKLICYECLYHLEHFHTFKLQCKQSQNILKNWDLYLILDGKDGRNNKNKDKTESSLNRASTSQEECIEPSLIEIGDKDNDDDSTNYLSQNQLIFREDVAALLKQIQTSSSCNQLEIRDPFKSLKSSGPKSLSLASTSFEQTKLSFNTEPLKCQKPINLKSVDLTSLKNTYSSSSTNLSEGDEDPHFPRHKPVNLNLTRRLVPVLYKLKDSFESGVEKESYPEPPILLPNTLETLRGCKSTLDTSSKSTCTSLAEDKVSELESKNQIDEVDDINQSDLENTSQEILDDLVKHVAKKKRKTNNGKVKEMNQSFQWRFVKKVTDSDGQERYQCTLCKKSYASKWYLKEHLKIHTGEKNFCCSMCDKRFRNNYMLNFEFFLTLLCSLTFFFHIRLHTGIKNFHCSFCPKKFYNNFDLVHHERHHTGEKPFKCKYCDKAFAYKRAVENHMRIHTGERPYPCSFCSRAFIDKNQQVRHHRVHTGDRPYSCNLCGQAFKQISTLYSHRRVHSDERPYSCNTCDLSYKWKSDLVKHFATYHSDLIASVVKSRIEGDENTSQLIDEAN